MPRGSRVVVPDEAHHVTQSGTRQQDLFFNDEDRRLYLELLHFYARRFRVEIIGYCLLPNRVHHLLAPSDNQGLRWTIQLAHKAYADQINKRMNWRGHLWQERFHSAAVDVDHFWIALRYIERAPVELNLVPHASDYPFSSAAAHCWIKNDPFLTKAERWTRIINAQTNWYDWLGEVDGRDEIERLKKSTARDLPCGSDQFLDSLEARLNIRVRPPKRGRPRKVAQG